MLNTAISIIREVGGNVTDAHGTPWTTDAEYIVASNGLIHNEVLDIIRSDIRAS